MKLSILIATIGRRQIELLRLLEWLMPQVEKFPEQIEVIVLWNNGEYPIGELRQKLMEEASGDYVCFIDDDDDVPDYYCSEIINALGKDYVGFQVELFEKDKLMPPVFHSIKYGVWSQDEDGYYRGVTHLNPIRRELALQGKFSIHGAGEDESWSWSVTPLVRTENYIDKIMYYYHHDMDETTFSTVLHPMKHYHRPHFEHPQFRWHSSSTIEGKS